MLVRDCNPYLTTPNPDIADTDTTDTDTIVIPDVDYVVATDEELEKPYRVMIENDDVTPMDFVVEILRRFFAITITRAVQIMLTAHYEGEAYVTSLPYQEAQERVHAAHSAARAAGYPLTFYLEPEE
jgi:ATP-dependent Clp protease adaptor protein ClpS